MHVISYKRIREFSKKHPNSSVALKVWFKKMKRAKHQYVNELKRMFSGVDIIGKNRCVFNICGNKYRIVTVIIFASQKIYIRFIGTDAQYSKINCSII